MEAAERRYMQHAMRVLSAPAPAAADKAAAATPTPPVGDSSEDEARLALRSELRDVYCDALAAHLLPSRHGE